MSFRFPPPSNSLPQGEGVSVGIAEPVPSVSEESHSEFASSLTLLAMTEKGAPRSNKGGYASQ